MHAFVWCDTDSYSCHTQGLYKPASKMAQWSRELSAESDNLSPISATSTVEGDRQLQPAVLWPPCVRYGKQAHTHVPTYTNAYINGGKKEKKPHNQVTKKAHVWNMHMLLCWATFTAILGQAWAQGNGLDKPWRAQHFDNHFDNQSCSDSIAFVWSRQAISKG